MDLKELWNKPEAEKQSAPEREALAAMLSGQSRGILGQLRRKLLYKILWGAGVGVAALIFIILYPSNLGMLIVMGPLVLMVLVLGIPLVRFYRKLPDQLDMGREILPVMKEYDQLIRSALRFEERVGSVFIVPSPGLGAMASLLNSDKDLGEAMTDWRWLLILFLVTVIFAPLAIWLAKWMNRVGFGKYLNQLSKNIAELEKIEVEQ